MKPISKPPIFRHYQLTIEARDRAAFVAGGTANLLTSLRTEPGTLAMFATHADSAGTRNEVFELYQDEVSYQIHAQSPQFKRYGQLAQQVVRKHQMAELKPQVLVSTADGFEVSGETTNQLLLTEFTAGAQWLMALKADWNQLHNGSLIQYAATLPATPTSWVLLSIYPNATVLSAGQNKLQSWLAAEAITTVRQRVLAIDTMISQPNVQYVSSNE
ncbi:putative quinol monooxygenase [Lactiplantibacillus xiangfangensis]|uniref:ABM domain-containing protein n=1 Tax=Lactiplantibacillus xiangfangensis TaxID=942150 RepID=A0A0R2MDM9_9LACO|nr:antibiotic biosynthesis monooxygenase [Lactiplantibacillus xiangfangensis]KRO11791.1 hypothetical protein IV64_GL002182 [Lactiplantibacillus xiangfangensis]